MHIIKTTIRNLSRYPRDIVWENAQDLEHVAYLHSRTNKSFRLMHLGRNPDSKFEYDTMIYRAKRRLFRYFSMTSFGTRQIVSDYNLHQVEYVPLLNITSCLNSVLKVNEDPEFPTVMVDEVILEIPIFLAWLEPLILSSLKRHATIQCQEDEPFRERRVLLRSKGIQLPYKVLYQSDMSRLESQFVERPNKS